MTAVGGSTVDYDFAVVDSGLEAVRLDSSVEGQQRCVDLGAARLIEGAFPNYRQLIPDSYPSRLVASRESLLAAIDRASLVAEDHIPIRLSLSSSGIDLSVSRQDVGGETEHVEAEYNGEEMTIAFNSRYLNDGVTAVEEETVALDVLDPLKPGVLRGGEGEDFLYLLMPVRL